MNELHADVGPGTGRLRLGANAAVSVTHGPIRTAIAQIITVDDAGRRHEQKVLNVDSNNDDWVSTFVFDVPHDKIKKVILQARAFDKFVVVRDIALTPDARTTPKIEVVDAPKTKGEEGKR